jgi:hypothetical protein
MVERSFHAVKVSKVTYRHQASGRRRLAMSCSSASTLKTRMTRALHKTGCTTSQADLVK